MEQQNSGNGDLEVKHTSKKQKIYKNPSMYKFNCECGRNFNHQNHFKAHLRKYHNIIETDSTNNPKKPCVYCDYQSKFRNEMIKHYELSHKISIAEEKITFSSQDEFLIWKNEKELNTHSKFSVKGTRTFSKHKLTNIECHRSGYYSPKGNGLRSLKSQGSVKINGFCPSRILLKSFNDGKCIIYYCGTHIGHQNELQHLTLTHSEREDLAKKISMKISFDDILDEIRDSIHHSDLQRKHLLTRKDLYNLQAAFNLQSESVKHKDDANSVDDWARKMQNQANCVFFYKPQGIHSENHPYLQLEDFVLIIMTDAQLDILKKYGNNCLCLDTTYGLNNDGFELNSLSVLDEHREGFPCAFLISNRLDTQVLELFFQNIRDQLKEPLKPKVFMSDSVDTFFNAWVSIMGIPEKRLFCTWHVDRSWRKNLNKIKSREMRVLIYKHLRTFLTEHDRNVFLQMLQEFCCINDEECEMFIKYFQKHFVKNCEYWAYCYRSHDDINNNMHFEIMHRSLKYTYSKGKSMKRLDKGITAIMRFIRDKSINRVIANNKKEVAAKIANISSRHHTMEKMVQYKVIPSGEGWEIMSEKSKEVHLVQKQNTSCIKCPLVCSQCQICLHKFQCSCMDSAIKYNMCKHIHLVARSMKDEQNSKHQDHPGTNVDYLEIEELESEQTHESGSESNHIETDVVYMEIDELEGEQNYESARESNKIETEVEYLEIDELESEENYLPACESSKNTSDCEDLNNRKQKLINSFIQTLDSISTIEELGVMESLVAQASPSLAAIRDKKVST